MPPHPLWTELADLTLAQIELLHRHLDLLLEHNQRLNLTAIRDRQLGEVRHTADALTLLPHLGDASSIADLGSGGGVPGVPLAIALPHRRFTLIDSVAKKMDACRAMIDTLGLSNVDVIADRAENVDRKFDAVVARAVAPMKKLVAWSKPLLNDGGVLLALKGRTGPEEAAPFKQATVHRSPVGDGVIIELRH
ncbi:MAG: 16S rRNA (guanine(527)-N(7))-methyltransferase RsmG [Planctomycetota bacterium]